MGGRQMQDLKESLARPTLAIYAPLSRLRQYRAAVEECSGPKNSLRRLSSHLLAWEPGNLPLIPSQFFPMQRECNKERDPKPFPPIDPGPRVGGSQLAYLNAAEAAR